MEVEETKNFELDQEEKLIEHVTESINEYLGMEMIFSLVSSAQEWLNLQWDEYKREKEEVRVAKLKAYEEVERVSFYFNKLKTKLSLFYFPEKIRRNSCYS